MNDFTVTLKILRDILEKKLAALTAILSISQNQETILQSPPSALRQTYFGETSREKQERIDTVMECDEIFQSLFDSVKGDIEDKVAADLDNNKPEVLSLQALISQVLERDIEIRAQELRNSALLKESQKPEPVAHTPAYRRQAINELNKHKRH